MRCYYPLLVIIFFLLLVQTGEAEEENRDSIYNINMSLKELSEMIGTTIPDDTAVNKALELKGNKIVAIGSDAVPLHTVLDDENPLLLDTLYDVLRTNDKTSDVYVVGGSDPCIYAVVDGVPVWKGEINNDVVDKIFNAYKLDSPEYEIVREASEAQIESGFIISQGKAKGFNLVEIESLLSQAKQAYSDGNYTRALELAEEAKVRAESIVNEATAAESAVDEAEYVIPHEKSKGFDVAEAESLLSQAKQAFSSGDYTKASELAEQAKALAPDIDQDGVPNDADFAPATNNSLIYAGVVILLAGSAIALIASLKTRERLRLERQRKEEERRREQERKKQEQLRREKEERRLKEEERRRKEKMVQDVLDMIEDVTKGEG